MIALMSLRALPSFRPRWSVRTWIDRPSGSSGSTRNAAKGGIADQGQPLRKARLVAPLPVLIPPAVLDEMQPVLDRPIAANQPHQPARAHLLGRQRVKPSGAFEDPSMVVGPTLKTGHVGLATEQAEEGESESRGMRMADPARLSWVLDLGEGLEERRGWCRHPCSIPRGAKTKSEQQAKSVRRNFVILLLVGPQREPNWITRPPTTIKARPTQVEGGMDSPNQNRPASTATRANTAT